MKTFDLVKFCNDLKGLRNDCTQVELAERLEINRSSLSLLETGKQIPSLEILTKVCSLGDFQASDYFAENENDGLIYLMGTLEDSDKEKINRMMENIHLKEKYAILSKRCV